MCARPDGRALGRDGAFQRPQISSPSLAEAVVIREVLRIRKRRHLTPEALGPFEAPAAKWPVGF